MEETKSFGISLYGGLARAFKKKFNYNPKNIPIIVNSVEEIMRAMSANFPGFRELIRKKGYYKVVRGKDLYSGQATGEQEVKMIFNENTWHLFPIAAGAKGGGALMTILGAVLIVVGVLLYVYGGPIGMAASPYFIKLGAILMLSGLVQMLTPMPKTPESGGGDEPSYLFNGAVNIAAPGLTVPVAYGETWIGGIPISFGVDVRDIGSDPTPTPPQPPPVYTPPTEPTNWSDGGGGGEGSPSGGDSGEGGTGDGGSAPGGSGQGCGEGSGASCT